MRNDNRAGAWPWLWCGGAALAALAGAVLLAAGAPAARWCGGAALLAAVLALAGFAGVRRTLLHPLAALRRRLDDGAAPEALRQAASGGAAGAVAEAAAGRVEALEQELAQVREATAAETEARVRRDLAGELCRSALPQRLRESPATATFALAGAVEPGQAPSCTFYDYFFIDPGLLCIMVGQVPGEGIAEALYMVVAQTTIRSRLRMGRSLVETMADVNLQLYDQGARQSLCALVATLNTANGAVSYVNAGGALPLLLRSGERYEWLEAPVYAALGMNENVAYRAGSLRLRQGDRLFLQTAGLGEMRGRDGTAFREQELRAVLNRSRSRAREPEEILRFTADEAAAFCPSDAGRIGYAALVLEYRKGDKELAHCEVPAVPSSAGQVTAFLNQRFADNGIRRRDYARVAVLVDELFALCCRCCAPEATVITECGIAPDGQSVTIRMRAPLGGRDPLEAADDDVTGSAAEFIRSQVDYLTFKAGEEQDTLTAVCFLEGDLPLPEV